uniref:PEGA domain-containing protein n=1 Tax=Methanococcus maripaludis (strain C6 / ATCC BAA-1332) TaxID=444158 RepID=A9A6T1_METM6
MKKSFFLFLLLLLSVIGSVNAIDTVIQSTDQTSSFKVVISETTSSVMINDTLLATAWTGSAPTVVGWTDDTIYFASKNDMYRFVSVPDITSSALMFNGNYDVYEYGVRQEYTLYRFYGYSSGNNNVHSGTLNITSAGGLSGYIFGYGSGTSSMDTTETLKVNGDTVIGINSGSYTYFQPYAFSESNSVYVYTRSNVISGVSKLGGTVLVKGYPTYEILSGASVTFTELYVTEPMKYDLTIDSNVDGITVYNGETDLGTANDGTVFPLIAGTYDLTFIKEGYFNETQTVEIIDSAITLTVDMETTHLEIPVSIFDSEGGLNSVNLYIDDELFGTVSNNQDVSLPRGTHELIFEKSGYWSETRTVTVDELLTELSIRMYPESVFFKISNTPSLIQTYSNSEVNIALNIDPNDYAYGVKLYLTGQEVLDVRDSSNVQISKQDSYYLLDDFSSAKTVNVKINSGTTLGTNSLAVRVTGYNVIGTEFVTDSTINYEILRLPLSLTVPSWCIGSNSLTVIETEGITRTVVIKLADLDGNILQSDSHTFEGFETYKFTINFEEPGDYKLYVQSGDLINTYIDVSVDNPISLTTKTLTVSEGSVATAKVLIENSYSEPQYYRITIEGDPLVNSTKVDFSISPGSTKEQSISFTLLDELDYDSYSLPLKVYLVEESGLTEIYSDSVILNIGSSGSFIPFLDFGDDGIIDTVITFVIDNPVIDGIIIIAGLGVFIFSGRKKGKKPVKTIKKPVITKGGKKGGKK